jgi:hypothetical protein
MRNCAYCGAAFVPKQARSICCSRAHTQQYSRVKRPRNDRLAALMTSTTDLPCCRDWQASGADQRAKCPQHREARKMHMEDLQWRGRLTDMHRISDDDWLHAGYTIH